MTVLHSLSNYVRLRTLNYCDLKQKALNSESAIKYTTKE